MGTYTANYQLYMPSIGEQGWGDLMNGNLTTIDTTMKSLSNRITAVENEVNGALSCTSVTTSGTITSTGVITANGGVKGNVTGNVTGNASTATKLNKVVTVTPTSVRVGYTSIQLHVVAPYIPGVTYSGSVKCAAYSSSGNFPITMYIWDSSGAMSTQTNNSTSDTTMSFSNATCVKVHTKAATNTAAYLYMSSYS